MGYWKEKWLEEQGRVYSTPDNSFVCSGCVIDDHLAKALVAEAEDHACSYCGASQATDMTVLLDEIADAISAYYSDPAEELPYESREGGYQGTLYDGNDLVYELDDWTKNDQLLEDTAGAFQNSVWTNRNYFAQNPYEALSFGWRGFSEQVKHHTRFLFLQELEEDGDPNDIPPGRMLDALGKLFHDFHMVAEVPIGTEFSRARVVKVGERPSSAKDLGTAPREQVVRPNRMSPAGIPMFYAAIDDDTAVLETYQPARGGDCEIALARFRTLRPLRVLDLTQPPQMPSVFDQANREKRRPIVFLREFEREFTRPVARDDKAHVEYVPTQVVTEYVRHRFRTVDNQGLDGIRYKSSHPNASTAVVLFADPEHCGPRPDRAPFDPAPFLELTAVRYAKPAEFENIWKDA